MKRSEVFGRLLGLCAAPLALVGVSHSESTGERVVDVSRLGPVVVHGDLKLENCHISGGDYPAIIVRPYKR